MDTLAATAVLITDDGLVVPALDALQALYDWVKGEGIALHPDLVAMVEDALPPPV